LFWWGESAVKKIPPVYTNGNPYRWITVLSSSNSFETPVIHPEIIPRINLPFSCQEMSTKLLKKIQAVEIFEGFL
jgi:hypothetical protein